MALLAFILSTENDPRLTVHTIVREDIFAGYMVKDMVRLAKGEAMLEQLDKERPDQRQHVRAWQGGAVTFRAVLAYERGERAEGDRLYSIAESRFTENTPYSRTATTWKENPETVAHSTLLCKSCHESGRLEARKTTLPKAPQR